MEQAEHRSRRARLDMDQAGGDGVRSDEMWLQTLVQNEAMVIDVSNLTRCEGPFDHRVVEIGSEFAHWENEPANEVAG